MADFLAHSPTDASAQGHALADHLSETARLAAEFFDTGGMDAFAPIARDIALYHDAGKYKTAFQRRLTEGSSERVDHSTLGGQLLFERYGKAFGTLAAFAIMGHHGSIPNGVRIGEDRRPLEARLSDAVEEEAARRFDEENHPPPPPPFPRLKRCAMVGFEAAMLVRMLHSALVDADYLDTERYFEPERFTLRKSHARLGSLLPRLQAYMADIERKAPSTTVNRLRKMVREDCELAAELPKGFFTLSVPTGGGKTLASLNFALRHARVHPEISRVIYAIPFTSIIEQNAAVFRDVLGRENVLEHHSSVNWTESPNYARLASENWDAPVIVTTNVQLFESLYAANPSKCRKNHNLINSIIILDEAQALPDAMLKPCLQALCSLVRTYGATVVICTATQPDLSGVWPEKPEIREIIRDVPSLFAALKRTRTTMLGTLSDDALLSRMARHEQALCIVNTRAHAQKLFRALDNGDGVYHLSALMCPEHRTEKLDEIRLRLNNGEKCVVFSTSLVEAGVDLDFPYVYRALAGLDSVAQAAGRCNRNGRGENLGEVYVFRLENGSSLSSVSRLGEFMNEIVRTFPDIMSREAMDKYFALRFSGGDIAHDPLDEKRILKRVEEHRGDFLFPFAQIARDFEMIRSAGEPLFVPYDDRARELIRDLVAGESLFGTLRALRRYAVTVYPNQMKELKGRGFVLEVGDAKVLSASAEQMKTLYTGDFGLDVKAEMPTLFDDP